MVAIKLWALGIVMVFLKLKEVASSRVLSAMEGYGNEFFIRFMKRAFCVAFTCLLATGGAIMGTFVGAMKGQTTETGLLRGGMIGAVSGAITAIQLLESTADDGESMSKVALLRCLVNEKVFMEWMSTIETSYRGISDYDITGVKALSKHCIRKLPAIVCGPNETAKYESSCSICLKEMKEGEVARRLPECEHEFHLACIDQWLVRQGSCPICRNVVCSEGNDIS